MAAKNQVQFQRGMSLMSFLDRYGSEQQCCEALAKARWPDGFRCPDCDHPSHCHLMHVGILLALGCTEKTRVQANSM